MPIAKSLFFGVFWAHITDKEKGQALIFKGKLVLDNTIWRLM
jgi:hypothetical protein